MSKPTVEDWIDELEAKVRIIRERAEELVGICDADLAEFIGEAATMADTVRLAIRAENEACAKVVEEWEEHRRPMGSPAALIRSRVASDPKVLIRKTVEDSKEILKALE